MLYEVGRSSHPLCDSDRGRSRIPQSLPPRNPHAADIPVLKLDACRKQRAFSFTSATAIPNKVRFFLQFLAAIFTRNIKILCKSEYNARRHEDEVYPSRALCFTGRTCVGAQKSTCDPVTLRAFIIKTAYRHRGARPTAFAVANVLPSYFHSHSLSK